MLPQSDAFADQLPNAPPVRISDDQDADNSCANEPNSDADVITIFAAEHVANTAYREP